MKCVAGAWAWGLLIADTDTDSIYIPDIPLRDLNCIYVQNNIYIYIHVLQIYITW